MLRGIPDQAEKKRVHSRAYHTALTQAIHQGLPEEPRLFPNSMFIEVLFVYREILYRSVVPHICTAIQVPTDFVHWGGGEEECKKMARDAGRQATSDMIVWAGAVWFYQLLHRGMYQGVWNRDRKKHVKSFGVVYNGFDE